MKKFRKCSIIFVLTLFTVLISSGYTAPISEEEIILEKQKVVEHAEHEELSSRSEEATKQVYWKSLGEFSLTAYCSCPSCCGKWAKNRPTDEYGNEIVYTSTGTVAKAGRTIAVDPTVIPHGSKVKIGETIYTAEDTGSAIKKNKIDIYFDDHDEALKFGRQKQEIYILVEE